MLGRCSEVHGGNVVGFGLWGMVEAQRMVGDVASLGCGQGTW